MIINPIIPPTIPPIKPPLFDSLSLILYLNNGSMYLFVFSVNIIITLLILFDVVVLFWNDSLSNNLMYNISPTWLDVYLISDKPILSRIMSIPL